MVGALVTVGQTFVLFTQSTQTWAVVREPALGGAATPPEHGLRADYMTNVMRRRPPRATKPMPISGACALVVAIAMPPTKVNTPTTAAVDRLT